MVTWIPITIAGAPMPAPTGRFLLYCVAGGLSRILAKGGWLLWRAPLQLRKTFATRRSSLWAGTLSGCGSACRFTAFALADVALVRSVGQTEIVFTPLFSRFYPEHFHDNLESRWYPLLGHGPACPVCPGHQFPYFCRDRWPGQAGP